MKKNEFEKLKLTNDESITIVLVNGEEYDGILWAYNSKKGYIIIKIGIQQHFQAFLLSDIRQIYKQAGNKVKIIFWDECSGRNAEILLTRKKAKQK